MLYDRRKVLIDFGPLFGPRWGMEQETNLVERVTGRGTVISIHRLFDKKKDGAEGEGYTYWRLTYQKGKRIRERAKTLEIARSRAKQLIKELAGSSTDDPKPFSGEQVRTVRNAVETLAPLKIPLSEAARRLAEAHQILDGKGTIQEAARMLVENFEKKQLPKITVGELYTEYMKELVTVEPNGKKTFHCSFRYWQDNTGRLGAFIEIFKKRQIASITTRELEDFFNAMPERKTRGQIVEFTGKKKKLTGRTRNNYKGIFATFFGFARDRGYLPRGVDTEAQHIRIAHDNKTEKQRSEELPYRIYRPAEMQQILDGMTAEWIPFVVLGAFAGIRTAEIYRLDWRDVNMDGRQIVVDDHKAKVGSKRYVPISDQLATWLAPHVKKSGWICPRFTRESSMLRAFGRVRNLIPVRKVQNGHRHSYASYRMAEIGDLAKVSWDMGNSPMELKASYVSLAGRNDLAEWLSILPKKANPKKV